MNFILVGLFVTVMSVLFMRADESPVVYLGMLLFVTGLYLMKHGRRKLIEQQEYPQFLTKP